MNQKNLTNLPKIFQKIKFDSSQLSETAERILEISASFNRNYFLFNGDVGVGKTTLIKEIVRFIDEKIKVSSPSFTTKNTYEGRGVIIHHIDNYKLSKVGSEYLEDNLNNADYYFIEWSDLTKQLIKPGTAIRIDLNYLDDDNREVTIYV